MTGLGSVTFVLLCGLSMARIALGAECIGIRPVDAPQPIPVYGALCGKAVDQTGGPLADAELDLFSEADVVVAKAHTDPTGTFKFSPLPTGKYRVGSSGFLTTREILDITSADQQTCERPLSVRLSLDAEECAKKSHQHRLGLAV